MDPKAKYVREAKRTARAFSLLQQACQLMQWKLAKLDDSCYVIGRTDLVLSVKDIIEEEIDAIEGNDVIDVEPDSE